MRHYELMVILDPDLEERTIAPSLDTFLNVVRNGGGTVEKVDVWGRRRLSFEIDKKAEGIYAVVDLNAKPDTMKELDRQLNLNESILRTKVMRPEMRASKAEARQGPQAVRTAAASGQPRPTSAPQRPRAGRPDPGRTDGRRLPPRPTTDARQQPALPRTGTAAPPAPPHAPHRTAPSPLHLVRT